ncbi:MAG: hypothetical protein JHC26_07385 [Thermofilum sp.]|jgi:hypothetical protein|uniref:hypothetical protein n=1 Tax=Thermofilum sp. TaxID=1961369 RepID=UPI0025877061|nr:hypothetical protein [Thermofilum sp.]MCI4408899.1 hypothetical protein [Thermofilum sp.]
MQKFCENLDTGEISQKPDPKDLIIQSIISEAKKRPLTVSAGTIRQRASRKGIKIDKGQLRKILDEILRNADDDIVIYEKRRPKRSMPRKLVLAPRTLKSFRLSDEWVERVD